MPEPNEPHATENASVRYQAEDARISPVILTGIALILLAIVVHAATAWMYIVFASQEDARQAPMPPLVAEKRLKFPRDLKAQRLPGPILQTNEALDLAKFRRAEEARLHSYGWVDAKSGRVHIPIAEAMKRLADPATAKAHGIRVEERKPKGAPR
jgi:hypothetical protein